MTPSLRPPKPKAVVDLFSGAGGFSEGFKQAGFDVILGVDNDPIACETFKLNHECRVVCQDIMEPVEIPFADVIIGSPPCPHFSEANRGFKKEGQEPDLSLVERFMRIVRLKHPRYWVMENVVGVLDCFPEFRPISQILCANEFGLYHKRARAFIGELPTVKTQTGNPILYPTPVACDDHVHKSSNNPRVACLSDHFNFTPDIDVFKKVMGFPPDYVFVGKRDQREQIKQIGNAVCPPVARDVADAIKGDAGW